MPSYSLAQLVFTDLLLPYVFLPTREKKRVGIYVLLLLLFLVVFVCLFVFLFLFLSLGCNALASSLSVWLHLVLTASQYCPQPSVAV